MIQRIIPAIIGITLLISGCATQQQEQGTADFNTGATLLKVAHLPSPTADGSSLFITIDGQDAGPLPVGKAILLQLPAGDHLVGGYASSLIGHVTIPSLKVTTSADSPRFVAYQVKRNAPLFIERGVDPLPQSAPIPEKQVSQSEPVPVPQITTLSLPKADPVTEAAIPATQDGSSAAAPAVPTETAVPAPAAPVISDTSHAPVVAPEAVAAPAVPPATTPASNTQVPATPPTPAAAPVSAPPPAVQKTTETVPPQ